MTLNVRIAFTPAAKAVQRQPTFQVSQPLQQLLPQLQEGDTVHTPPCTELFVVAERRWRIEANSMESLVILDLGPQPPSLTTVP